MKKFYLIDKIKKIISEREPNKIQSIFCNFDFLEEDNVDYNYNNLIRYWKEKKDEDDELVKEYSSIKDMKQDKKIGIISLFYFKDNVRFLAVGKNNNDMFHLDLKCPEYQKVLTNAISSKNELYILTYWIM